MDYKRAYEELREVYLKDKQAADELAELVEKYVNAYRALKYEFHHGNVHSHSRANHKHDGCLAALSKAAGKD
jgi:hypothetical protein